jgi:hypothetical protein
VFLITFSTLGKSNAPRRAKKIINDSLINRLSFLLVWEEVSAGAEEVLDIELRMEDVKQRYGSYPKDKWDRNIELKNHFENKSGKNIYELVEKDSFKP